MPSLMTLPPESWFPPGRCQAGRSQQCCSPWQAGSAELHCLGWGHFCPTTCQRLLPPADELGLLWVVEVSDWSRVINSAGQEAHCKVMSDWRDWQQLKLLYEPSQGRLGLSIQRTMQTLLKTSWFCTGLSQVKARRVWDCREGLKLG